MNVHEDTDFCWRKSSYSGTGNGNCVEVGFNAHTVAVRDSKAPMSGRVEVGAGSWRALVAEVRTHLAG